MRHLVAWTYEVSDGVPDNLYQIQSWSPANRTAAGLGALFAGQAGYAGTGGGANVIKADGSNISPQALALLNFKLPNGQFMNAHAGRVLPHGSPYPMTPPV